MEWKADALCRRRNPDLYDEDMIRQTGLNRGARQRYASSVCYGCPVMAQCAQDAIDSGANGVIRGATFIQSPTPTDAQRIRLRFVAAHGRPPRDGIEQNEWWEEVRPTIVETHGGSCEDCGTPVPEESSLCESCSLLAQLREVVSA